MTLFDSILSLFGLKSSDSKQQSSTDVTVEHDPDAENEAAVKGTDASASTGSMTEEPPEDEGAAEPAEAVDTGSEGVDEHVTDESGDATGPVADRANPHLESKPVSEADSEDEDAEPDEDAGEDPVDTVSGIGPAYASKLGDAGVENVAELAAADPAELADQTDISEKRLTRLVERAQEQLD